MYQTMLANIPKNKVTVKNRRGKKLKSWNKNIKTNSRNGNQYRGA